MSDLLASVLSSTCFNNLYRWVHMPYFEAAVKGCFVRVGIGAHEGKMVYRVST